MRHGKKLLALMLLTALLLSSVSIPAWGEDGANALPKFYWNEIAETGAADSFVRYPVLSTPDEEYAPVIEAVNQAIQEKARIPEYLQLLSTIQEGSTGLRLDYELGGIISSSNDLAEGAWILEGRYLSLLFSAEGKMLQGRPSQVYYPMTFDLATGDLVTFDQLFTDPEGAKAYIEVYLEEEIEPTLSTYLENNQLFPVPYDRFFLDGENHLMLVYENSQMSFLSGYSGAVSFRYSELEPWLETSPDGVAMQLSALSNAKGDLEDSWNESEFFWEHAQGLALWGIYPRVFLNDDAEVIRQENRCTVDSGYYPGGAYFEVEEPRLLGTLILTDDSEETVTGILTHRADLLGIVTGKTMLAEAEDFLGADPTLRMDIGEALAEIYRVCPGTASVYQFNSIQDEPLSLTLYADENGIVQYVKYAFEQ